MDPETIRQECLAVLRTIAQPISVLTTLDWERTQSRNEDPSTGTNPPNSRVEFDTPTNPNSKPSDVWHGATLSSFTSIAMYPYPLISFALRTPARMADLLRPLTKEGQKSSTSNASFIPKIHLVINLLASHQAHLAIHFSRPRSSWPSSPPSSIRHTLPADYSATAEGIPVLHNTLGALCCTLVNSFPLDTTHSEPTHVSPSSVSSSTPPKTSELFIARVMSVLSSHQSPEYFGKELSPLVYHKQQYCTVK